ncbi:M1 family metallopeptidase [Flavobacterium stagni]|uniref:M1 family peptidase n=1 Tax=Flavobacterium stagni TaxID=2506421 RepID=A0A4Q1K9I7_9FLAO|nr:M1 family metallopeptidase [Flavobacterium stagni]RXR23018.1 M1 family peptidase [Flavobacterium stagni]
MRKSLCWLLCALFFYSNAQERATRKDSLMGGFSKERTCYDVKHYTLNITLNPDQKFISGSNTINFDVLNATRRIQVDLFANMQVDSIIWNQQKLKHSREFNAVFVDFPNELTAETSQSIQFYYSGNPLIAKRAPWDGGFVFTKDKQDRPWIGVAVQGTGASLWMPIKDGQSDEPDTGIDIKVAVPNGLMNVSNGRFKGSFPQSNGYTRWDWEVTNPINSYDITLNVGHYIHWSDKLDDLDLDYYVLDYNRPKAEKQFAEVKPMLTCFQSKFGPYPFKEDGYKLVETSYLGMEHQSAVAYGNKYFKGYLGSDLSGTGVGLLFDFIIIHESGHEWFGNSITSRDIADMWIHEGFTQYSEMVYIECQFGYEKALLYGKGLQKNVTNDRPIIGDYGVNAEGSGDMYPKGALLLNTLRHALHDDALWWKWLAAYTAKFKHQIITTPMVIDFFNQETQKEWTSVFDQYLKYTRVPELQLRKKGKKLEVRWITDVPQLNLPIYVNINDKEVLLNPTNDWTTTNIKIKSLDDVTVDLKKFFITVSHQ